MRPIPSLAAALLAAGTLCSVPATAAMLAYEGFDYRAGAALVGSDGGSGFSSAWQSGLFSGGAPFGVAAGSLTYPGQSGTGHSATQGAGSGYWGVRRSLASPLGADGSTAYLSFLVRPTAGAAASDFFGLYLEAANPFNDVFVGKGGGGVTDRWVVERRGGQDQVASDVVVDALTTLLVLKMEFHAGVDTLSLFVNPSPGTDGSAPDAVGSFIDTGAIGGIGLFGSRGWTVDEIRLGDSLADVTPARVPEPATWTLLPLALLGLGVSRRRRA